MVKIKNRNSGFTLIELIVTLVILGIVITAISSFFSFNLRTFFRGDDLSQVQFDVRMASDFITTELRNVIALSSTVTTHPKTMDATLLTAKYPSVNSVSFVLGQEGYKYIVEYTVSGNSADMKNPYSLKSKVVLNNIVSLELATTTIIYYAK